MAEIEKKSSDPAAISSKKRMRPVVKVEDGLGGSAARPNVSPPKAPAVTATDAPNTRSAIPSCASKEYWEKSVLPMMTDAKPSDIHELAGALFIQLWDRCGADVAQQAVAAFLAKVHAEWDPEGVWRMVAGNETIGELDLDCMSCKLNNSCEDTELDRKSTKEANTYKFKGFLMDWGCCTSDFKVRITFEYDDVADTIDGEVQVDPVSECHYGPPDAHGGYYSFKGSRVKDEEEEEEEEDDDDDDDDDDHDDDDDLDD
jgi:hypothetical protein